ncbi:MAG: DUF1934 domain-containing protein [Ruminococcus sp.]|nr:DUF1934 domain-containing protein [Ruminococcus sp.]
MAEKKKYMISIIGEQKLDDDTDKVEVLTTGNYIMKNDHCYIGYKEYDQENPGDCYDNLIKVEKNMVTITRKGPMRSQLMLEKGRRHQCLYQTIAGDLMIGVFTKTMKSTLNEKGGTLEVSYTLDFNTDLVSENKFKITIEENN